MASAAREETHFGEKTVPLADKQGLVDDVFHSVARRYDLMNDLMSGGLHRAWKDALVTAVNPPKRDSDFALLDLAGGTGDVAFRVVEAGGAGRASPSATSMPTCSPSAASAPRTRPRPGGHFRARQCRRAALSGPQLRLRHHRLRHPQRAAHRARAGRSLSRAQDRRALSVPGIFRGHRARHRRAVRTLFLQRHPAHRRSGDRRPRGLSVSRRVDPQISQAARFADMIRAAGFRRVSFTPMTAGVVALHSGWKL